eukprot:TRINITY_DN7124_c0_g2_i4.p1 TRINITY_DN7124_c0_g2~~TRINITY_DN7124_c0_g2_i4.p1  ORF type:complete len:618 (-),score=132.74 TRINITY_DN7124_c0_g2_i4:168-2021(-)
MNDATWLLKKASRDVSVMDKQITDADVMRFLQGCHSETVSTEGDHSYANLPERSSPDRADPKEGPLYFGSDGRYRLSVEMAREVLGVKMVIAVLRGLGLVKVQDSLIGDAEVRGISGGQKKRMAIGRALVSNPYLIFLDEPTSGLSAADAIMLMREVKCLVDELSIVAVSVIHQPRNRLFKMFDNLVLLCDGKTIYSGPPKSAASKYFAAIQHPKHALPNRCNPADHYIDHITATEWPVEDMQAMFEFFRGPTSAINKPADQFFLDQGVDPNHPSESDKVAKANPFDRWEKVEANGRIHYAPSKDSPMEGSAAYVIKSVLETQAQQLENPDSMKSVEMLQDLRDDDLPYSEKLKALIHRERVTFPRDQMRFKTRIGNAVVMGILIGIIYTNIEAENIPAWMLMGTMIPLTQSVATMPCLFRDRPFFQLERSAGLYGTSTFYVITVLYGSIFSALTAAVMMSIMYSFSGLPFWPYLPLVYTITLSGFLCFDAIMYLIVYSCATLDQMMLIFNFTLGLSMFANGFTMSKETSQDWISWLLYGSPAFYSFEASLCAFAHYGSYSGSAEVHYINSCSGQPGCLGNSGDNVVFRNIMIMATLSLFFHLLAWNALRTKHRPQR